MFVDAPRMQTVVTLGIRRGGHTVAVSRCHQKQTAAVSALVSSAVRLSSIVRHDLSELVG